MWSREEFGHLECVGDPIGLFSKELRLRQPRADRCELSASTRTWKMHELAALDSGAEDAIENIFSSRIRLFALLSGARAEL